VRRRLPHLPPGTEGKVTPGELSAPALEALLPSTEPLLSAIEAAAKAAGREACTVDLGVLAKKVEFLSASFHYEFAPPDRLWIWGSAQVRAVYEGGEQWEPRGKVCEEEVPLKTWLIQRTLKELAELGGPLEPGEEK